MFNVGGGEILVILLLALLVLGPDKLPEYARKAGRYMNEFRRMTSGFQEEFRQAMDLSDTDGGTPAPAGDALDRTTEGPRLLPQAQPPTVPTPPVAAPEAPAAPTPPASAPSPAASSPEAVAPGPAPAPAAPVAPPEPAYGAAFAADVTPAPGTGPELVTPPRPGDHGGDPGSSSAA